MPPSGERKPVPLSADSLRSRSRSNPLSSDPENNNNNDNNNNNKLNKLDAIEEEEEDEDDNNNNSNDSDDGDDDLNIDENEMADLVRNHGIANNLIDNGDDGDDEHKRIMEYDEKEQQRQLELEEAGLHYDPDDRGSNREILNKQTKERRKERHKNGIYTDEDEEDWDDQGDWSDGSELNSSEGFERDDAGNIITKNESIGRRVKRERRSRNKKLRYDEEFPMRGERGNWDRNIDPRSAVSMPFVADDSLYNQALEENQLILQGGSPRLTKAQRFAMENDNDYDANPEPPRPRRRPVFARNKKNKIIKTKKRFNFKKRDGDDKSSSNGKSIKSKKNKKIR